MTTVTKKPTEPLEPLDKILETNQSDPNMFSQVTVDNIEPLPVRPEIIEI